MGFKSSYNIGVDFEVPNKLNWWYAPLFAAFWLTIFLAVVTTQNENLPTPLTLNDEASQPDQFIAERAEKILLELTKIGPRVVGSVANEVVAVAFLQQEIEKVIAQASDYFEFEMQVQEATGNYIHWSMINMYQSIQNVVVKMSARNSSSQNYLLINSHYDSVPGSAGAGDDGSMVVVMLEVMRVIAKSQGPLENPIVFLFNGAEENPLQASHAFITQHEWAKNCKALINLDAAGSGGRELLFQSSPKHPWLMRYYRNVPHPLATSFGEEVFQSGVIPSDTDFRIFRDYGAVPGFDMAYIMHGYVYHTELDTFSTMSRGSLQNTGDNVLVLAKSIANAPEMRDTKLHQDGNVVFFDFLGWFMVFYTLPTGVIINIVVCCIALIAIITSLYFMSKRSGLSWPRVLQRYCIAFGILLLSIVLGAGLSILVSVFMDAVGASMTWFTENWLLIGLYVCPYLFGVGILPAAYLERTKNDTLSLGFRIQLFMHANCLFLILLTITLTALGIRSSFMCMMAVLFDIVALIINLVTKWHRKAYWFAIAALICQILPFIYFTSIEQLVLYTVLPMMGRFGSANNIDLVIAALAVFFAMLFAGFIMPLFLFFRKTRTLICCFLGITVLCIIIAVTPAGFPFRARTSAQRINLLHVRRIIHNADNSIKIDESGIYVYPQDRRINTVDEFFNTIGEKQKMSDYCAVEMFCGMPHYNHRWNKARDHSFWIPLEEQPNIPGQAPSLLLNSITDLNVSTQKRFQFELTGPDHMTIFIGLKGGAKIIDWSFNKTMIRDNWEPPYFIYFSYGKDSRALIFTIDVEKTSEPFTEPSLEIGVAGHWTHHKKTRTNLYQQFVNSLPEFTTLSDWVATYENWLF